MTPARSQFFFNGLAGSFAKKERSRLVLECAYAIVGGITEATAVINLRRETVSVIVNSCKFLDDLFYVPEGSSVKRTFPKHYPGGSSQFEDRRCLFRQSVGKAKSSDLQDRLISRRPETKGFYAAAL